MSLIDSFMTPCVILNSAKISDGQGGFTTEWTEGAQILVAFVNDTSMNARRAEKEGVTSTWTLTMSKANALSNGDVVKRLEDDAIFRITGDAKDKISPIASTFDMAQVSAEKWSLPA